MIQSIFTRPLFINPQAYLIIPELSYIQMTIPFDFTENSYSFKIKTSGKIEGKLLKAGKDYILHLDLYSIDGNCVLGEFYLNNSELNTDNFSINLTKNVVTLSFGESTSGNIVYPGLIAAWSAAGKTNNDEDRATLKDLTGNGHDITLNGFAFSEMSGYGGYYKDFSKYIYYSDRATCEISDHKLVISEVFSISSFIEKTEESVSYKINVTGLNNYANSQLWYRYYTEDNTMTFFKILNDGEYVLPQSNKGIVGFLLQGINGKCNITIEQIPEYPDALVFDGVDDYGINDAMPILTDYTIVVKRNTFIQDDASKLLTTLSFGKNTSNVYELANKVSCRIYIDGNINEVFKYYNNNGISFSTNTKYNGIVNLIKGDTKTINNNFYLGILNGVSYRYRGAFYSAYLFDRSLDEQEIKSFIRKYIDPEYLLPSEIPTPDCYYDFSLGSNDDENKDTIVDQSGNGNNAVAHNFSWNEEGSGYKDGALYFDGVDDYISLDAFDSGFKTVFMKFKPIKTINAGYYDQIKKGQSPYYFAIAGFSSYIAFTYRNTSGKTYINGILNTSILSKDLVNKNICVGIVNENVTTDNTTIPKIGDGTHFTPWFANMTLYKFLGFKEALTDEQIQYVINKYNLLDGVDDIEVS